LLELDRSVKIEMIAVPDKSVTDFDVHAYQKGCVYDVPGLVGALMVCEGWARPLPPDPVTIPTPRVTESAT
jgi:hypothetical protein